MKLTLFILFLNFTFNSLSAQNLTLAQILEVKKKDLGNAEEYLSEKGWEFLNAEAPDSISMGRATFTYNKNKMSNRAESFIDYIYSDYSDKTRISIQINNKLRYTEYLNSIKGYNCKLMSSKVEAGRIIKIYRGETTTFRITSATSLNGYDEQSATWYFLIISNYDYDLNYAEN